MKSLRLAALVVVTVGSAAVTALWSVWMSHALDEAASRERRLRMEAVRELLDGQTTQTLWATRQVAAVAAADPRPRAALSIEPFDLPTLADAVAEVQQDTRADWLGLCSNQGRVLAAAGPPALKAMAGVDLKDSRLFKQSGDGPSASALWFTANGPMVVTAAPVMKGSSRVGVMLIGRLLEQGVFERAASIAGGAVGLLGPAGEWAGSTAATPDEASTLRAPSKAWPGVSLVLVPPEPRSLGGLWLPLVIVGLTALLALFVLSSLQVPLARA
jgi:hypothetical protein